MTDYQMLTTTLKQAGMRITPQRVAVCKLLAESEEHPTATRVYEQVKAQYPTISLATIYNTLDVLVSLGAVNVLGHAGDDNVHYDADTEPHVNLACVACHKIVDIPSEHVTHLDTEITKISGYKLLGARVLYYGLCPDCQSKPTDKLQ
jgi:Fur family transcriptional regulator, peroxide stress response regulator